MTSNKPLFVIKDLKKYFPLKKKSMFSKDRLYVKANDGIDLTIYKGETLGIVGESGCGKSTFGRTILQLYDQTAGTTKYYGRSIEEIAPQYIIDILKDLPNAIDRFEKNRQIRRDIKAKLATNPTDEKLQNDLADIEKKIDEYFDNTVTIFGGLALSDDLSKVSKTYLDLFVSTQALVKEEANANKLKVAFEADNKEIDVNSSKYKSYKAKKDVFDKKINEIKNNIANIRNNIEDLKKEASKNPKFEKYEARKDLGVDLTKLTKEEMRKLRQDMQIIFQDPYSSLDPRFTVGQIISEGLIAHGQFKNNSEKLEEYVIKIMEVCGLAPYMIHRYPHQFSGGQRQRIGIARALALNPKVIVCDESVSALDVSIQSQILNLLKDLKDEKDLTYIFITHDLSVVKYISDRICVMYLGNVMELSSSEDLFKKPLHPYTEALLSAIPTTDEDKRELILLEGDIPSPIKPPKGCKFHTRCPHCMDICKEKEPEMVEFEKDHFVACHLRVKDVR